MLDGIDLDDQENVASVKNVIKAVLDGVKVMSFVLMLPVLEWSCRGVFTEECFLLQTGIGEADY